MYKCYFVYLEGSTSGFIVPLFTASLRYLQATENEIQVENNNLFISKYIQSVPKTKKLSTTMASRETP